MTDTKRPTHGCNGCDERWWGANIAHCAAPGCHRTFSSPKYFDLHRDQRGDRGSCLDPATVLTRDGRPAMEFRDGQWRGPELDDEGKAKMRETFDRAS